jgi:PleD family two-component response regulator
MDRQSVTSEPEPTGVAADVSGQRQPAVVVLVAGGEAIAAQIRQRLEGAPGVAIAACPEAPRLATAALQGRATVIVVPATASAPDPRPLLRELQAEPGTAELPAIVLGGSGHPGERRRAFAAGAADHWLELPERTELLARLQVLSRGAEASRARDAAQAEIEALRRQLAHTRLAPAADVDPETALPGRGRLEELLDAEWRRARRRDGSLAVVVIDLGEDAGSTPDRRRLAGALRSALRRGGDLLARYTDARFAALLPEVGPEGAATVARALVRAARGACPEQPLRVGRAVARPAQTGAGTALGLLDQAAGALTDPALLD